MSGTGRPTTPTWTLDDGAPDASWQLGPSTPGARRKSSPRPVELRSGAPVLTLRLASFAHGAIRDAARASADGRETGGLLLGPRLTYGERPVIVDASGPGPSARRGAGDFGVDHAYCLAVERAYADRYAGCGNIGFWHTHPTLARDGGDRPSRADLEFFQGFAEVLDVGRYLALILTPDALRGWERPSVHGWMLTRFYDGGRSLCERVAVDAALPTSAPGASAVEQVLRSSWRLPAPPKRGPRGDSHEASTSGGSAARRTAAMGDRMMLCVRSFAASYDGQRVELREGRDLARASHPLVRKQPENWAPAGPLKGTRSDPRASRGAARAVRR